MESLITHQAMDDKAVVDFRRKMELTGAAALAL
jgi:hypothetical protein